MADVIRSESIATTTNVNPFLNGKIIFFVIFLFFFLIEEMSAFTSRDFLAKISLSSSPPEHLLSFLQFATISTSN